MTVSTQPFGAQHVSRRMRWTGSTLLLIIGLLVPALAASAAGNNDVIVRDFDFSKGQADGWQPENHLRPFDMTHGVLATQATGSDAFMHVAGLRIPTASFTHVVFRMKSDKPGSTQVYFGTTASPNFAAHEVPTVSCPGDNEWHEFSVKLYRLKGFSGDLTDLRLDPVNGTSGESAKIEFAYIRLVRMAPRVLFERFSADNALPAAGSTVAVTLRFANTGGPLTEKLNARLDVSSGVTVERSEAEVQLAADSQQGEAHWRCTMPQPGIATLTATIASVGHVLLTARTHITVVGQADAAVPPQSADQVTLTHGNVSLAFLRNKAGACAAALLRVKDAGQWKPVGVLSPLAEFVTDDNGVQHENDVLFDTVKMTDGRASLTAHAGDAAVSVVFSAPSQSSQIAVIAKLTAGKSVSVCRFATTSLRVGIGADGGTKSGGLFPGQEFLEGDEPSSNIAVVGKLAGYRPYPDARTITVPALAIRKDNVLAGMMWQPLQDWGAGPSAMPAAEFASPNFLDNQKNHLLGCFVPDTPWRTASEPVATDPFDLKAGHTIQIATRLFAVAGMDLTDVVPLWYQTYGLPAPAPAAHSNQEMFSLLMQAYGKTLWDPEKRGFTSHYQRGEPHWFPSYAVRLLVDSLRTGEQRWVNAIGIKPGSTVLDVVGSMFDKPQIPPPPAGIDTQLPGGLWGFRKITTQNVLEYSQGFSDRLGEPGAVYVGYGAERYAVQILAHAMQWGDDASITSGLKALQAMDKYRVPRGAQTWEVPAATPDLYGAARIADCYRMGYELTGEKQYLSNARYWLYTGLPFLYAYRVPGTGPGVSALVSGKGVVPGTVYYKDPDRHYCTPWGSIPVFGTSLYRVSWFGTLVQFCGLVWANSVYEYLQYAADPVLRAAADGVTQTGANITLDQDKYAGLLPDSFSIMSNRAQPTLIGPTRLEPPLRHVMDLPDYGNESATVVLAPGQRVHIHSLGVVSAARLDAASLEWRQRFVPDQVCETLVLRAKAPQVVTVNGRALPHTTDILHARNGWTALPGSGGIAIRIQHDREYEDVRVSF